MSAERRLVIASNRLPFCVQQDAAELTLRSTSGGLASALGAVHGRGSNVWVGWPGDCSSLDEEQRAHLSRQLDSRRVVPVDLATDEVAEYYDGVCNSVLWPVFHYMIDRLPVTLPDFRAYRAINERFADAIAATYRPGDIVWIHDYHLLLAPAMVRAHVPDARIGFFFHTPFPAPDVFRVLPWSLELLDGVLGASLVGFQTERDAENFAATMRVLTDYGVDETSIVADRRTIRFGAYPIGIDPMRLEPAAQARPSEGASVLDAVGRGRRLLLGIDRLDYTKGISRRLAAFELLLETQPRLRGQIELLQVAVPSRCALPSYIEYRHDVEGRVEAINAQFGTAEWTPIHYAAQSIPPSQLGALYRAADVMLVTSLRDGMNLVAKEFVSSRADEDGVLILSELAGACEELTDAVLINPYSIEDLADAIASALAFDRDERRRRMRSLRARVAARPVQRWVDRFVSDLAAAGAPSLPPRCEVRNILLDRACGDTPLSLAFVYEEALIDQTAAGGPLNPDPELLHLLGQVSTRMRADVHVISRLDRASLGRWFDTVPVTMWGEDGLWCREPDERRWRRSGAVETEWMTDVREFLGHFTTRTPGAFVEERATGLAWHFGRAGRVTGRVHAQELFGLLRDASEAMGFVVRLAPHSIELGSAALSRACAIQKVIERDSAGIGRLVVFESAGSAGRVQDVLRPSDRVVSVGASRGSAVTTLPDSRAVRDVLQRIVRSAPAARRTFPLFTARRRPVVIPHDGAASRMLRASVSDRATG
ncbi:MAG: bifunctional alpha,alpha-trehalose-phosphate synthase (UDP-forming)/trehalose-phosphatase [Acidobacteriota bacterium]